MLQAPGWFFEDTPSDSGRSLAVRVTRKLAEQQSQFQKIEIYDTESVGRMLVLDNIIQLTESDEFAYHEMFVHVPMNAHPAPESALVIGGGDGGILRELNRYAGLQRIDSCEIDDDVIQLSKQYLPFTACGFDDPRVSVHVADGAEFARNSPGAYDLILVDSTDPIGPAEVLFQRPFFETLSNALKPGGVVVTQCMAIYLHLNMIRNLIDAIRPLFARMQYMNVLVPTYPAGVIGLMVCSSGADFSKPIRPLDPAIAQNLKYYTPAIHSGAFALPRFAEQAIAAAGE